MSGSFALERPLRIAYLGPEGSYSHLAAVEKFGSSVEYEPVSNINGVFDEVSHEHADFGLVPIENSVGGGVIDTLDALVETDVQICAEISRVIHHNLLANCALEEVERVYSKPEVFSQCQRWLAETDLAGKDDRGSLGRAGRRRWPTTRRAPQPLQVLWRPSFTD